jgi:hypothetical protein
MVNIDGLSRGYGRRALFDELALALEPGNIDGLLGVNGAGSPPCSSSCRDFCSRRAVASARVGAALAIWFGLVFIAATIASSLGSGDVLFEDRLSGPGFFESLAWLRVTETQVSHGI